MNTVLLVEDNFTLLEDIALALEMQGYKVLQATDGQFALKILASLEKLPDIVVSDIAMPDMDGFQLLDRLRNNQIWTHIPFIFLTAFDSPNSVRISKELGADDYIVKPFRADDLILAIDNKLKRIASFQKQAEHNLDEARQSLLHMMSHELRTPLTAIYGGSAMLAESLVNVPDNSVHQMMEIIQNGAHRLNRLSMSALTLLQIDSGHLQKMYQTSRRPVNLNELMLSVISRIEHEISKDHKKISIKLESIPDSIYVMGIMDYLHIMIEEPLRNAVAFSLDFGQVDVAVSIIDSNVCIVIHDQGPGIPESSLPYVWDRFVQINRNDYEQQGIGLGLAITRECTRIHGGDCIIESGLAGTYFTITLPLYKEEHYEQLEFSTS